LNEDLGGRECVATGAVPAGNRDRKMVGNRFEAVIEQFRQRVS
jgi:hypothetical protein